MRISVRWLFMLLVVVGLSGCETGEGKKLPPGVLGKDKMIAVMADLMVAEAKASGAMAERDSMKKVMAGYYAQIAIENQVTVEQIRQSLDFYSTRPEMFRHILRVANDTLTARRAQY